jgi:hypothetical protein
MRGATKGSGFSLRSGLYVVLSAVAAAAPIACTGELHDDVAEEEASEPMLWQPRVSFGFGHHPRGRPHHEAPRGGYCRATSQDGVITVTLQTGKLNGTSMLAVATSDRATRQLSVDKVVRRHGVDVIVSHDTGSTGSMRANVRFSSPIRGIREATGTSDGVTVQGTVDGRAIVPHAVDLDPNQTRFADGRPAPRIFVPFGFSHTLRVLEDQAESLLDDCSFERLPPAEAVAALTVGNEPLHYPSGNLGSGGRPGEPRPGAVDQIEDTYNDLCARCGNSCAGHAALEVLGCLFLPFVFACEVAAIARGVACGRACDDVGSQCCPIDCGGTEHGEGCCATGTQCINATEQSCCYSWEIPCGGKECCFGTQECVNGMQGPQCCEPCGSECCNTSNGFFCKDATRSQCCKDGQECGTACCASDPATGLPQATCEDATLGLCCNVFTTGCAGRCCDIGQVCANGQCAPPPPMTCLRPELACANVDECVARLGAHTGLICADGCCQIVIVK